MGTETQFCQPPPSDLKGLNVWMMYNLNQEVAPERPIKLAIKSHWHIVGELGQTIMLHFSDYYKIAEKFLCEHFHTDHSTFKDSDKIRKREYVQIRQLVMSLLKKNSELSLARIGMIYNKDHATTMHAIKTVDGLFDTSRDFREICKKLDAHMGKYKIRNDFTF